MVVSSHPNPRKILPNPIIRGPEHGFQPDTKVPQWVHNYILNDEGLGGLINYAGGLLWLAKNPKQQHIHGVLWCEQFLVSLVKDMLAPAPQWKVLPSPQMNQLLDGHTSVIGPLLARNGVPIPRQYFQCMGAHPMDVGTAMYFSSINVGAELPILDYPESQLMPQVRKIAKQYVVFTCGGTTPIRTMTGEHLNPLIRYVKSQGLTPVFLGKRDLLNTGKVSVQFADDTNYSEGIDLRDQTPLKSAACIMQHAACTVGIDGGLLHLAACMKDSRVVFGYNITTVAHREPRRSHGKTVNVTLTKEELPCIGCQSNWIQVPNTMFDECNYAEGRFGYEADKPERVRACLRLMFANDSEKFKRAIDEAIA